MRLVIVTAILMLTLAGVCEATLAAIVVGKSADRLEALAARELRTHLYAATGSMLPVVTSASGDVIAVGTPDSNPLIRQLRVGVSQLGDEGYLLRTVRDGKRRVLIVTGNTPVAVMHGVYGLLEEYGFGFSLGGDSVPARQAFRLLDLNVTKKPAFAIRGVLPWYNFFDSPTAWDFEDYAFFFDQLAKTKNNFIGFHSYDHEPFAAYEENGRFTLGEPLQSTANYCWGTVPMKTSEFGGNTSRYFSTEYFGAKPSLYRDQREKSIRDSRELLAKALDYAKSRGLKTCVGFEVTGKDPTDPADIAQLEKRLRGLLTAYPMLDYVWIWENEAKAINPDAPPSLDSDFGAYYRRCSKFFDYLDNPARAAEAIRMGIYAIEAHRILSEIAPRARLAVSGWGGDRYLRFSEFYPGLDKMVPKDVIFSALDHIDVQHDVADSYGKLSPDRERWPIPWFEYDGDQWFPQQNAKAFGDSVRDALAKGSRGILGIHWRTRDVEESHAYMSQLAWEPKLTFEEFYRDYARTQFGSKHAEQMAAILMEMQSLGYRLVGGSGQIECGTFGWGSPPDPRKIETVARLADKLRAIQADLLATPGMELSAERVAYLRATCLWALAYEKTASVLRDGGAVRKLLTEAKSARDAGDTAKAMNLAKEAEDKLRAEKFGDALEACARRVTDRGDLGSLATVNAKAWVDWQKVRDELGKMSGSPAWVESGRSWPEGPMLSPVGPNSMWFAGEKMPVRAVTHVDGCEVRLVWTTRGASHTQLMVKKGRYFEGAIACPKDAGVVDYALELLRDGKLVERWPGKKLWSQVTLAPGLARTKAQPFPVLGPPVMSGLQVTEAEAGVLMLTWSGGAGRYEIRRSTDGGPFEALRTVSNKWFEDRSVESGRNYCYSVTPLGTHQPGRAVLSETIAAPYVDLPKTVLSATPRRGSVGLKWGPAPLGMAGYLALVSDSVEGPWRVVNENKPIPADTWNPITFRLPSETDKRVFCVVVGLDRQGKRTAASDPMESWALPLETPKPILALDLKGEDAHFFDDKRLAIPHRPEFNVDTEMSVLFWAKLESAGQMPVLISHGTYGGDGYFLQILGGRVRFYLHGVGCVDAGAIEPGKWRHIAGTYDGSSIRVYIDGELVGETLAYGRITPCSRNLYIGRYEIPGPEYETDCRITAVRLYDAGLFKEEVQQEMGQSPF